MKKLVDSFSPVRSATHHQPLASQYGTKWLRTEHDSTFQSHHGVNLEPSPTQSQPRSTTPLIKRIRPVPYATLIRPHIVPMTGYPKAQVDRLPHGKTPKLRPYQQAPVQKKSVRKDRRLLSRILNILQIPLVIIAAVFVGFFMQSLLFGEIAICIFAIFAIVKHLPSRTSFQLAFITLIGILVLNITESGSSLAANFAIYTFLLLGVGTISLILETHHASSLQP